MARGDSCSRRCESAGPAGPRIHIRGYAFWAVSLNPQRSTFNPPVASSPGLGRSGSNLDFDSGRGFSIRDQSPVRAEKSSPPSPEVIVELHQQQRMLAELIGPRDISDADRSKSFVPQPRSERAEMVAV